MSVYAIQESRGGPIKIGSAGGLSNRDMRVIADRRKGLQCGNPYPLRIMAVLWQGNRQTETDMHAEMREYRLGGEWFEPCDAVCKIINDRFDIFPYGNLVAGEMMPLLIDTADLHLLPGVDGNHKHVRGIK